LATLRVVSFAAPEYREILVVWPDSLVIGKKVVSEKCSGLAPLLQIRILSILSILSGFMPIPDYWQRACE